MRRSLFHVLLSLALLQLAACGGSGGGPPPPVVLTGSGVERIDIAMNDVMTRYAPPGIAVAVVHDGKLAVARAWGSANLDGSVPLQPDNLFRIASISKPITGVAALRAIEDGLLDPDAAVFDILSSYLPQTGADPRIMQITVRQLLHHTSGWTFYDYPSDPLFRTLEIADAVGSTMPPDPQALTRWVAMQPLDFDPGTRFTYTNIGYVVLGRVLEQATGYAYEDFVRQFVLQPAGVSQAGLAGITRSQRLPGEVEYESFHNAIWSSVFDGVSDVPEPAYGGINLMGLDASSAWAISAVDLVRFAAAVDGDPAYPDIILPETFRLMTTVGTPTGQTPLGVAWFLSVNGAGDVTGWEHSGGMPGTSSYLVRLRSGDIAAVITNTAREPAFFQDLAGGLVDAVNGISEWPDIDLFERY